MSQLLDAYPDLQRDLRFFPLGVDQPRHLSREQIQHYNEKGYIAPIDIFDADEITIIRNYFDELLDQAILGTGRVAELTVDAQRVLLEPLELRGSLRIRPILDGLVFLRNQIGFDALQLAQEVIEHHDQIPFDREVLQRLDPDEVRSALDRVFAGIKLKPLHGEWSEGWALEMATRPWAIMLPKVVPIAGSGGVISDLYERSPGAVQVGVRRVSTG